MAKTKIRFNLPVEEFRRGDVATVESERALKFVAGGLASLIDVPIVETTLPPVETDEPSVDEAVDLVPIDEITTTEPDISSGFATAWGTEPDEG